MDEYFNEGLAEQKEIENPFEIQQTGKKGKKNRKKSHPKLKRFLVILAVAAVLAAALFVFILVSRVKNDGARYARKLSEQIGVQIGDAQKKADVTLVANSAYPTLNSLFASYQGMFESKKSCRISGVKMPEWAIFCNTDAEELTNITYYNYAVLEKNVFGTNRKSYIDPNLVPLSISPEEAEEYLNLKPYLVQYLQGKTVLREYRYCYKDGDSGDNVAYVITAVWDENNQLTSITDNRKNYIGTLLASPQN